MTKPKTIKTPKTKPFGENRFIKVRAHYLKMLAPFISSEETRYYLHGIYIVPASTGVYLVATDGRRMGIIHDPDGVTNARFICPVNKALLDSCKKDTSAVFCGRSVFIVPSKDCEKVKGLATAQKKAIFSAILAPIDGVYPDWQKVLPTKLSRRQRPMSINPVYIVDFIKVLRAAGIDMKYSSCLNFYQTGGSNDPLIVRHPKLPEFVGLQMPMRIDPIEPLPNWLPKKAQ